ncbi:PREDICTED: carboxymethylenebutenolidase homolog isoform X1 [Ipomoea nil]|uniref:carboxymethylenebutenolidase homolog isoform X1 n=1 Tax=Ipomoea nil TaxID=35883 RepID=UPI000901DA7F|nr:PREDICTED: carboxymethylenebutenolidase homolog isoform X1 [Ipomoea nil]
MAMAAMGSAPLFTAPETIKPPFLKPLPTPPALSLSRSNVNCWGASLSFTKTKKHNVCCCQVKVEDEACELVNGVELSIGDEGDSIDAYLLTAVKNNNGTGILLLSDVFGFEDSFTRDFAYRVACNGYNVLVPDLFRGDPWGKDRPAASFEQWIGKQDRNRVIQDTFTSVEWMVNEFVAAGISKKLGVIGFCYGGGLTLDILAKDQGSSFGAGISFYGTRINTSLSTKIKSPLLLISGNDDPLCPVSVLNNVAKDVEKSKVVVFKGRGHGFVHRPQSPEEDRDAEEAFVIMRSWLNDFLPEQN